MSGREQLELFGQGVAKPSVDSAFMREPDFGNIIKSSSNNVATHFNDAMEPVLFLHVK